MNFEQCVCFQYKDYTGDFVGNKSLFWNLEYQGGGRLKIITKVRRGVPDLEYLKYLVSKGAKFVDNKDELVRRTFGGTVPQLIEYLYSSGVIQS